MSLNQRALAYAIAAAVMLAPQIRGASITPAAQRIVVLISLDGFPAYALDDPRLPVPELRSLASRGVWARRMTVSNPTVTWPNHTTLVTGVPASRHGVLFNGAVVRKNSGELTIDASKSKDELVAVPTLYDVAHAHSLSTAQVAWVAIDRAPGIRYAFREQPAKDDPLVMELQHNGIVTADDAIFDSDLADAFHDQIRTKVAAYLIRRYKPNLLLVHLASIDSANHLYGPGTPASYNAMALVDSCVRDLRVALDAVMGRGGYTIVVVSDHGFKPLTHQISLPQLLRDAHCGEQCQALAEGGSAMVYLNNGDHQTSSAQFLRTLRETPGILSVVQADQFQSLGLPDRKEGFLATPDLVLYARPGYAFTNKEAAATASASASALSEEHGTHGYSASDSDMDGIFFAAGYGIRPGATLKRVRNLDIAPTLAQLLGLHLAHASGRVLDDILIPSRQQASTPQR